MNKKHRYSMLVKSAGSLALASLYLTVLLLQGFHPVMDHDHSRSEHCSTEVETDPCHQRIYHHNYLAGCHHPEHVHAPVDSCDLCDALIKKVSSHDLVEAIHPAGVIQFNLPKMTDQQVLHRPVRSALLRAPPELV